MDLKNYKPGAITINLSDDKLDNAQFIMMIVLEKYKIKNLLNISEIDKTHYKIKNLLNISEIDKTHNANILGKLFKDRYGILIGSISTLFGEFEFYINGMPKITTPDSTIISKSEEFKEYLLGNKDINTLHFETKAYIQVINKTNPNNYYGIFYSLGDAIKIASENDLVKTGEVTS